MAHALESDAINILEENLECTVCRYPLKDPRTLPCFHSFCKSCLEGVVKTCRDKAPRGRPVRKFRCPNCREFFTLDPDKNVADMRRNHFICNMAKAKAILDRGTGVPCSHNCSLSYSVARCVTCEKFLCRECLTTHNSYRGHAGHSVLTMEELSKPENRKKIKDKMYCNEHPGEILKVYCETCDRLICKDCMDFKHMKPDHSCFLVKDVASKYKELLATNNKLLDDVLAQGNAFVEGLTRTKEILDLNSRAVKNTIRERKESIAKTFSDMLDRKTETLLNEEDRIHQDERKKLDKQTQKTNQYLENLKRSVQLSKSLVDQGTEEEIISSQKMMLNSSNNLLRKGQGYSVRNIRFAVPNYTPRADKNLLNEDTFSDVEKSLGKVNTKLREYSSSQSSLDVKQNRYANLPAFKGKKKPHSPPRKMFSPLTEPIERSSLLVYGGPNATKLQTNNEKKYHSLPSRRFRYEAASTPGPVLSRKSEDNQCTGFGWCSEIKLLGLQS